MKEVIVRITEKQLEGLDQLVEKGHYHCRSSAIRTAVRDMLQIEYFSKQKER
ncbi:MAG: ribbon-helix-helix domain-containing protein [Candidatus Aenigmatarchaeota archaeon]